MPVERIDVLLNVTDVARSIVFYRDLLGLLLDATWMDQEGRTRWARLIASGGGTLMLNEPSGPSLTDREARPAYRDTVVYVQVRSVEELQTVHHRLDASSAMPGDCHDEAYGQREFTVRDPDGYEIAVCARLDS